MKGAIRERNLFFFHLLLLRAFYFFDLKKKKKSPKTKKNKFSSFFSKNNPFLLLLPFMSFSLSSSSSSVGRNPEPKKPNWNQNERGDKLERVITVEIPENLFFEVKYCPLSSPAAIKNVFETLQKCFRELELIPSTDSEEASESDASCEIDEETQN